MKDSKKRLQHIQSLLEKNNLMLEALLRAQLAETMKKELTSPALKKLFAMTARGAAVREIAKKTGIATGSASRIRQRWAQLGLLVKVGRDFKTVF
jgi:hypothetical protein